MALRGNGKWVELAAALGAGLPDDKRMRRSVIIDRCKAAGLNEPVISRMITARSYLTRFIDEDLVRASHRSVEMLIALDRVDAAVASDVRMAVLTGEMTRAALEQLLRNANAANQAMHAGTSSMSLSHIIEQCRHDLGPKGQFDWIMPPSGGVGYLLGADAEYFDQDVDIDKSGQYRAIIIYEWALVISPHIKCSSHFGSGELSFIRSSISLTYNYKLVSVFCSSLQELENTKKYIAICALPLAKSIDNSGKIYFHTAK